MSTKNRVFLSTIENIMDVTDPKNQTSGTIFLTSCSDEFDIHWKPVYDSTDISSIFQTVPEKTVDNWNASDPFLLPCNEISVIEIQENPLQIHIKRGEECRIFNIDEKECISFFSFIEQILLNGIAVPGVDSEYCLKFYNSCKPGLFYHIPNHIRLSKLQFKSLDDFWSDICKFYGELITFFDFNEDLPDDDAFPLSIAASSVHSKLINSIKKDIENFPKYEPINKDNFQDLFDQDGRIKDPKLFKERVYHAGVDGSALTSILPFALGVYPLDSSSEERKNVDKNLENEYNLIKTQVENIQEFQIQKTKRIFDAYKVIGNDVHRTDKQLNTFKNLKGTGPKLLTNYLRMYSIFNPPLGYLQGMNDLFVPIMLAYIPKWNEESEPIDDNGNIIECSEFSPKIFWCFESMIRNTNQLSILADVTEYCQYIADLIHNLLLEVSPMVAIWMRRKGMKSLLWSYGDLVLMFKRSFENVWPVWLQFNCSPNPTRWMVYFMSAILIDCFEQLIELPDVQLNAMMKEFPKILSSLDPRYIGEIAYWLSMKYHIEPVNQATENISTNKFKFFKNSWVANGSTKLEKELIVSDQ